MITKKLILYAALIIGSASCNFASETPSASGSVPSSGGTHNELIVFCDDELWEGDLGVVLIRELAKPVDGLPQAESHFDITRIEYEDASDLFKQSKSILSIRLMEDTAAVLFTENQWAHPQLLIQVVAPTVDELKRLLERHLPVIVSKFDAHNSNILLKRIKKHQRAVLPESLQHMGVTSMTMASGFDPTLEKANMVVMREDTRNSIQYLMAWETPSSGKYEPLDVPIRQLDSLLNAYFEGQQEGSYLAVEPQAPIVESSQNVGGRAAHVYRGLFRTEKGIGGGPFLLYSFPDENGGKTINLCYIVYGPSMKKRKVMMELETSLQSVVLNP